MLSMQLLRPVLQVVKRITVIHVLTKYLQPLLTMYFRIEFQDFKLMLIHV